MSNVKAFPSYTVRIVGEDGQLHTFTLPFTCDISVSKSIQQPPNTCDLTIYNLAPETREALYFDKFNFGVYRGLEVYIGYSGEETRIFKGNVQECYSVRKGVNFETHIKGWDGGMFFTNSWCQFSDNSSSVGGMITNIASSVSGTNVTLGKVSSRLSNAVTSGRPTVFFGDARKKIQELTGSEYDTYVDDEKLYVMKHSEAGEGIIPVIDASTGLLETPKKQDFMLECSTILEPKIQLGQSIQLNSITAPRFNGTYKVIELKHSATISENESGNNTTDISLFYGGYGFWFF